MSVLAREKRIVQSVVILAFVFGVSHHLNTTNDWVVSNTVVTCTETPELGGETGARVEENGVVPWPIAGFSDNVTVNRILDDVMKLKFFEPPHRQVCNIY